MSNAYKGYVTLTSVEDGEVNKTATIVGEQVFKYNTSQEPVGKSSITLAGSVTGDISITGWQYQKADSSWATYPNSGVSNTLVVNRSDNTFSDDKCVIKLTTSDASVYALHTITNIRDGAPGTSTVAAILTNEDQVLPANSSGTVLSYDGAQTQFIVYRGGIEETNLKNGNNYVWNIALSSTGSVQYEVSSDGKAWSASGSTGHWTYVRVKSMSSDTASIKFTASKEKENDLIKTFSLIRVKTGRDGDSPELYSIEPDALVTNRASDGTFTPSSIEVKTYKQVGSTKNTYSGRIKAWAGSDSGTILHNISSNESSWTIGSTDLAKAIDAGYITIKLYASGGGNLLDTQTIALTSDGTSVTITGQSVKYAVNNSGTDHPTSESDWQENIPSMNEGQYLWTRTIVTYSDGQSSIAYTVSRNARDGVSPSVSSTEVRYQQTTDGSKHPDEDSSSWSPNPPTAVAERYIWTKTTVTYSDGAKSVSYSVSRNGKNGTSATTYGLTVSNAVIIRAGNGSTSPSQIQLTAKKYTGAASATNYSGRFVIETTSDSSMSTGWAVDTYSSQNESSRTYIIPSASAAIRCSLYQASSTNGTLLDQQTIPVIGAGENAYTVILTNENHTFAGTTNAAVAGQSTTCSVLGYIGTEQVATQVTASATPTTGMSVNISSNNSKNTTFKVAVASTMKTENGSFPVSIKLGTGAQEKTFTKQFSYSLALAGKNGDNGRSIGSVINYYSSSSNGASAPTDWSTKVSAIDSTKQYLWNYEVIKDDNGVTISSTDPIVIGRYGVDGTPGDPGRGITSIVEWYAISSSSSSAPASGSSDWSTSVQKTTTDSPYLWNYEVISYDRGTPATSTTAARIIGTHGATGSSPTIYSIDVSNGAVVKLDATPTSYSPTKITLKAYSQTGNKAKAAYSSGYLKAESLYASSTVASSSGKSGSSFEYTIPTSYELASIRCSLYTSNGGTLLDQQTIPIVSNGVKGTEGEPAYTVVLTNENHSFSAGTSAAVSGQSTICNVLGYIGSEQVPTHISVPASPTTGMSVSIPTNDSTNTNFKVLISGNNMKTRQGSFPVSITLDSGSRAKTFTKDFSYSLSMTGSSGSSVTVSKIEYQSGTNNSAAPTGSWSSTPVSVAPGSYLWTKTTYSDQKVAYSVARQGVNGAPGTDVTILSIEYAYKLSESGSSVPSGTWGSTPVAPTTTQYAWTRTTTNYSDGKSAVTYIVGGKTGSDGTSPTAYNLIVSHAAVAKSQNGEYNPSSITLSAKSQTGSGPWDDYPGYFKIDTTEDNTTWTNRYTSKANESTKTYEISPDGWAITDSEPYLLRKSAGNGDIKSIAIEKEIVGGSIVWNQLFVPQARTSANGVTISKVDDSTIRIYGTATGSVWQQMNYTVRPTVGHKYFADKGSDSNLYAFTNDNKGIAVGVNSRYTIGNPTTNQYMYINVGNGTTIDIEVKPMLIDLTLMFGSTIADYIYTQEQATAGAGVALAKAWAGITADYNPYDAGSIKSVTGLTAHRMTGFNQWDEEWELGGLNSNTGDNIVTTNYIRSKNYISVLPQTAYYFKTPFSIPSSSISVYYYDANKSFLEGGRKWSATQTTPQSARYMRFFFAVSAYGSSTYNNDICINISDPSKNGTYEPYTAHTYPLDSSLTLRGLLKLDGDSIYYDGDIYPPSGEVKRRWTLLDLGTVTKWVVNGTDSVYFVPSDRKAGSQNGVSDKLTQVSSSVGSESMPDNSFKFHATYQSVIIKKTGITVANAQTMLAGVYLLYEKNAPTTEQAEPYTNPQIVYSGGTEEYIDEREVPIPVGHVTKYSPDITGIRCSLYLEKSTTTLLDQQTVPIVSDGINGDSGKDAYTVLLTNESHTFAGGKTAAVDGQTATIGVVGYRGTVQRATTVGTITGAPTGMTTAISNNSTTSTTVTVSVTSSMTTKNGTLTIPVTVDGTVFNLIFSYAIAFTGASGVGTSGLGWRVNASEITGTDNGECYFHGYDDQNEPADTDGWVVWNGAKLTIEKGYWINPGEVAPYNTIILHVYRTSGSSAGQRHCDVWWDSDTGKWMGYHYTDDKPSPVGKAEWTWNETTDCILATYVEPSKEGKIVSAQLFNPPKKFSELPDPKVGFDLEALDFGGRNMFLKEPRSYNKASYNAYDINLTELPVVDETYTVQLWDVDVYHSAKTAADTGLDIYWGGGSIRLIIWHGTDYFTYVDDPDNPHYHADYLVKTITITQAQAAIADAKNQWFRVYNSVSNVDGTKYMHIGKWKMEKGDKPTYWNLAPEDAATTSDLVAELIVGTHSKDDAEKTGAWTGTSTKIDQLKAGTRIQYKLPYAGKSGLSVTLNLTLADRTETGAKNVFYSNTTRLTNQYGQNAIIDLVYDGSAWRILNPYTNSNTVGVYGGVITAGTNGAKAYGLVMKNSSTTWASFTTTGGNGASKAKYTGGFEISNLMYFSNSSNLAAGSKAGTAYEALGIDFRYSSNCAQTLTSGQELYIVGKIHDDGLFYLDDTWWTQTEPTSNDGKTYIYVGITYSTYQVYLSTSNPAMQFYNGEFLTIEKIETIKAQEAAEAASKVATNYLDFNEQTGLDVGYSGTQAKTRISGDGVEIFDAQGVSMQEISSRTEEVNGQSVQVPFVRTGYTDQGHVETSSGGIDIKYGPEDTEYHTDLIAHLGYGDTVADPIWGEAQPGEIVQAPFYSFGPRALSWEDNDNVDHNADVGQYSMVTGKGCVGGGPWSYVGGYGNVTLNHQSFSTVVGYWNDPDEPGAFVVGGGSAPAIGRRRNTMVVGGQGHALMIHGDAYIDGGLAANPKSNSRSIQTVSGITVGSLQVYTCAGWCAVTLEITSKTTLSDWTTIATGMPIPLVTWYDTMTNWESAYHRPYRVAVTTSGNLNIRYGAGSSSDATAYRISFVYPMAT